MANSILQDKKECYRCGSYRFLESHHIFGASNRKKSEQYGFKVWLCHNCHNEPPDGVHFNKDFNMYLKRTCQKKFEETHTRAEFAALIGKNYL